MSFNTFNSNGLKIYDGLGTTNVVELSNNGNIEITGNISTNSGTVSTNILSANTIQYKNPLYYSNVFSHSFDDGTRFHFDYIGLIQKKSVYRIDATYFLASGVANNLIVAFFPTDSNPVPFKNLYNSIEINNSLISTRFVWSGNSGSYTFYILSNDDDTQLFLYNQNDTYTELFQININIIVTYVGTPTT